MARHDRNRPLYMISVAAELAGVHPQTLRIYEAKGIITPSRSAGNTRLYSEADVDRLKLVQRLTAEGINLAGVIRILDLEKRLEESEAFAEEMRQSIGDVKRELHEMRMREYITMVTRMDASRALGTGMPEVDDDLRAQSAFAVLNENNDPADSLGTHNEDTNSTDTESSDEDETR